MQLYDYALSCLTTSPLLHLYPTYTFSVYSVYSRLLGAPLRGSRSLGFLDFVSLSG